MDDHLCTALTAALSDQGAGASFHEFSGRIWAFCKRNAASRNPMIHYRNTKRKTNWNSLWNNIATLRIIVIGNRDEITSQH